MKSKLLSFIRFSKIDEEKRQVWGLATEETVDSDSEMMDYGTSKPLFEDWSSHAYKISNGKSRGNLREMHSLIAAGKLVDISFDDAAKRIMIGAYVSDESSWQKVKDGTLVGFSIGGRYTKTWKDPVNSKVTRFTAKPSEISLVDLPCLPTALIDSVKGTMAEFHKSDGTVEQLAVKPVDIEVTKADKGIKFIIGFKRSGGSEVQSVIFDKDTWTIARAKAWLKSHGMKSPAADITGDHYRFRQKDPKGYTRFRTITPGEKDKAAADWALEVIKSMRQEGLTRLLADDAPIGKEKATMEATPAKKSMYQISQLANLLTDIKYLENSCRYEGDYEEDDDDYVIADSLNEHLSGLCNVLKEMVDEETAELVAAPHRKAFVLKGQTTMNELEKKGPTLKSHFGKGSAHHAKKAEAHMDAHEFHNEMADAHKAMASDCSKADVGDSEGEAIGHIAKLHKMLHKMHMHKAAHHMKLHKAHASYSEHFGKMAEGYDAGEKPVTSEVPNKAVTPSAEDVAKAAADKAKTDADAAAVAKAAADKAAADAAAKAAGTGTGTEDLAKATSEAIAAEVAKVNIGALVAAEVAKAVGSTQAPPPANFTTIHMVPRAAGAAAATTSDSDTGL